MTVRAPFRATGEHLAVALRGGVRALFTSRRGGVSAPPYDTLNLGRLTGDDAGAVDANRDRLAALCGIPRERVLQGRQVHGTAVARPGAPPPAGVAPAPADGQATAVPGLAPLVLTADCLPLVLAADGAVAVIHAGWRGLAAGIVEEGVAALRALGADGPAEAAIGPGAGPCCYAVGAEVHAAFAARGHASASRPDGHLDLKAVAAADLREHGADAVHDAGVCTICDPRWFSHRRDGTTGRQAALAWLS